MANGHEGKKDLDPLDQLIKAEVDRSPTPKLSGTAKASIMTALEVEAARKYTIVDQLADLVRDIFKPAAIAALSVAGIAGLGVGALTAPATMAEISIEDEDASYYESTILFDDLSQDQLSDGAL